MYILALSVCLTRMQFVFKKIKKAKITDQLLQLSLFMFNVNIEF